MSAYEGVEDAAFEIYLRSQAHQSLSQVIENMLVKEDFDTASHRWALLDGMFKSPDVTEETKQAIFGVLTEIRPENRPNWDAFLADIGAAIVILDAEPSPESLQILPAEEPAATGDQSD